MQNPCSVSIQHYRENKNQVSKKFSLRRKPYCFTQDNLIMLNSSEEMWGRCPEDCDGQILDPFSDTNRAKEVFNGFPFFPSYEILNLIDAGFT